MDIEIVEQFADIFIESIKMLDSEIDFNKESNFNFNDVENLVNKWNNVYDKYIYKIKGE